MTISKFAAVELVDSQHPRFQQRVEYDDYFYKNHCAVLELGGVDVQDVDDVVHDALCFCFHL